MNNTEALKNIQELVVQNCPFYKNGTCSATDSLLCEFSEGGNMECVHFFCHVLPRLLRTGCPSSTNQQIYELPDLRRRDIVVLDTETTGLSAYDDRIVEIGLIKYNETRVEKGNLWLLLKSDVPLSPESIAVTGLTPEIVASGSNVEKSLGAIAGFIGHDDTVLVCHNAYFDISFINETFKRFNRQPLHNPVIDTFKLAAFLYPFTNCHLRPLAQFLGIDVEKFARINKDAHLNGASARSHRALFDAHLCAHVFFKLEKEYNERKASQSTDQQNGLPFEK